jgi:hypothetical protein
LFDYRARRWYRYTGEKWERDFMGTAWAKVDELVELYRAELDRQRAMEARAEAVGDVAKLERTRAMQKRLEQRIKILLKGHTRNMILRFARSGQDSLGVVGLEPRA